MDYFEEKISGVLVKYNKLERYNGKLYWKCSFLDPRDNQKSEMHFSSCDLDGLVNEKFHDLGQSRSQMHKIIKSRVASIWQRKN